MPFCSCPEEIPLLRELQFPWIPGLALLDNVEAPHVWMQQIYYVLKELKDAKKVYPKAFIHITGFDNKRQVQCISLIA